MDIELNYECLNLHPVFICHNREDVEGKSPNVSRTDENTPPVSSVVDPSIDDRSLLYQETW